MPKMSTLLLLHIYLRHNPMSNLIPSYPVTITVFYEQESDGVRWRVRAAIFRPNPIYGIMW